MKHARQGQSQEAAAEAVNRGAGAQTETFWRFEAVWTATRHWRIQGSPVIPFALQNPDGRMCTRTNTSAALHLSPPAVRVQMEVLAGCAMVPPAPALRELSPTGLLAVLALATSLASPDGLGPSLLMRKEVRDPKP